MLFSSAEVFTGLVMAGVIGVGVAYGVGWDLSAGINYRPFLNDNVMVLAGAATLIPGDGFDTLFASDCNPVAGCGSDIGILYQVFGELRLVF